MRYLRYLVLAALAVCLFTVALANREGVTLTLLPPELAAFAGIAWSIELPLFLVGVGGLALGLLIGFVWEWVREGKQRAEAARKQRELARLTREVAELRAAAERAGAVKPAAKGTGEEVLRLLEAPRKAG